MLPGSTWELPHAPAARPSGRRPGSPAVAPSTRSSCWDRRECPRSPTPRARRCRAAACSSHCHWLRPVRPSRLRSPPSQPCRKECLRHTPACNLACGSRCWLAWAPIRSGCGWRTCPSPAYPPLVVSRAQAVSDGPSDVFPTRGLSLPSRSARSGEQAPPGAPDASGWRCSRTAAKAGLGDAARGTPSSSHRNG